MTKTTPIVGAIEVIQRGPAGIAALVDGQRHDFPDLDAVFRTAVRLLDEKTQPRVRSEPSLRRTDADRPLTLPGFAP
jgi:hypothetical protein